MNFGVVSVLDFGAVGSTGEVDDGPAIQKAIDAGTEIHFPDLPKGQSFFVKGSLKIGGSDLVGGKRLIGHRPCRGGGAYPDRPALIQGDGSAPLLVANGSTTQNRAIQLIGLSANNVGKPVLDFHRSIDGMVDDCWFTSTQNKDATVKIYDSYNVTVRESTIMCSGGGFGIVAYQQCNKLKIRDTRVGGGSMGGAIHIEQSANVTIEGCTTEIGVYGIVVGSGIRLDQPAAGNVDGAGVCHCLYVGKNYFEAVQHPLVIGSAMGLGGNPGQAVFASVIECNNIGMVEDYPPIVIGRLQSSSVRQNSLTQTKESKQPAILPTCAHGAVPAYPMYNEIARNCLTNNAVGLFDRSTIASAVKLQNTIVP